MHKAQIIEEILVYMEYHRLKLTKLRKVDLQKKLAVIEAERKAALLTIPRQVEVTYYPPDPYNWCSCRSERCTFSCPTCNMHIHLYLHGTKRVTCYCGLEWIIDMEVKAIATPRARLIEKCDET